MDLRDPLNLLQPNNGVAKARDPRRRGPAARPRGPTADPHGAAPRACSGLPTGRRQCLESRRRAARQLRASSAVKHAHATVPRVIVCNGGSQLSAAYVDAILNDALDLNESAVDTEVLVVAGALARLVRMAYAQHRGDARFAVNALHVEEFSLDD